MPQLTRKWLSAALLALGICANPWPPAMALAKPPPCVETPAAEAEPTTVNVNTATAAQLEQLPRIGPKKALAIIDARTRLGGFKRPSQLLRVKGIGRATLRQLLPLIRLRDEPSKPAGPDGSSEGHPLP